MKRFSETLLSGDSPSRTPIDRTSCMAYDLTMPKRSSKKAAGAAIQVAEAVQKARKRAGLKQTELANRIGTSQKAITRIESGQHYATIGTLERVADATGTILDVTLRK